jgi:hypothetical protein
MTVRVSFEPGNLAVVRSSGVIKRNEVDIAKHLIHDHIVAHGKVCALMVIEDGFLSFEPQATWEDIEVDAVIQPNIIRLALVGDLRWRDQAVLFFMTAVASFQIEYFRACQKFCV